MVALLLVVVVVMVVVLLLLLLMMAVAVVVVPIPRTVESVLAHPTCLQQLLQGEDIVLLGGR